MATTTTTLVNSIVAIIGTSARNLAQRKAEFLS